MKNLKKTIAAILLFCAIFSFESCRKVDYAPVQAHFQNQMGKLSFRAVNPAGIPLNHVNIAISKSREDAMHNIYFEKRTTNVDGIADFGQTGAGTYYYKAEWSNTTHLETLDGFVTVNGLQTTKVMITFRHDNVSDTK